MDLGVSFQAFELSGSFSMAGEDITTVTLPGNAVRVLRKGRVVF